MRILALDDDTSILASLRRILEDEGYTVTCFHDAAEAATDTASSEYDLILVDYKMPEKNGAWFMKNARIPNETKVLLMTAYAQKDIIDDMFKKGVSGYLIKPFDRDELMRHIRFHVDN